jgi:uncharacterized membrane protein
MKTLMTFAAVAALVATASVASAQTNSAAGANKNGAFCVDIEGARDCRYPTMAACNADAKGKGQCVPNGQQNQTTGAGMGMSNPGQNPAATNNSAKPATSTNTKDRDPQKGN